MSCIFSLFFHYSKHVETKNAPDAGEVAGFARRYRLAVFGLSIPVAVPPNTQYPHRPLFRRLLRKTATSFYP